MIERELTGGGMSRVFLAREPRLERQVVIKLLPPQLAAGVPADRFEREIKLAAGLQHPHIVPVLTAGAAGELLYYVMPHVAGESVAERLELDGKLPTAEAARILRDVADALAYAHSRGIVHRDIKPANVLLSDNHGMVTDFGVAKALRTSSDSSQLTSAGFALGTPAYMAPEQAAGDPATDHRADLYAFGALAYEMVTGELVPKEGPDRAKLPPELADLISRCLAPNPADRPQSAAEIATALGTNTGPPAPGAKRKRGMPEITLISVGILVAVTAVIAILRGGTAPTDIDEDLVAILPFRVAGADSSLHYLREGLMDLLAAKLTGEGGPRAADPQSVMSAWRRGGGTETADIPQEAALALAANLGAGEVLTGGVVGSPAQVTINASIIDADGAVQARANVSGPGDSLAALVDLLAGQLLVGSAALDDALATRSSAALRAYLAGRAAYRRGDYPTAAHHLERALVHDSTLTQAALLLVCSEAWGLPIANFERIKRLAWDGRDRLSLRERALLAALLGTRYPEPPLQAEILELAEHAVDVARDNPDAWYLFGDEYFHNGAYLGYEDWADRARAAFERSLALDSAFADPLGHLVELAVLREDTADVRRLAGLFLATAGSRRGSYSVVVRWYIANALGDSALAAEVEHALDTVAVYPFYLPVAALSQGRHVEVERMMARVPQRATTRAERGEVATLRMMVLLNQGRLREALAHVEAISPPPSTMVDAIRVGAALRSPVADSALVATSVRNLARVAAGPPPRNEAETAQLLGTLTLLGEWAIRNGDGAGGNRAAARLRDAGGSIAQQRYATVWATLLDGQVAALRAAAAARTLADRADSLLRLGAELPPPAPENLALARLYESLGDPVQALAVVRRGAPSGHRYLRLLFLREEARLAAKTGDRAAAVASYELAMRMLYNADPEVVAAFETLKREIDELDR